MGDDLGEVRWKIVVDDVKGGGYYPKGVQLSPLNELSDELSCGLIGRVVVEICGDRRIWIVVASGGVVVVDLILFPGVEKFGGMEGR